MAFKKATKTAAKGRLALVGPSGSGKTFTALRVAQALGKRIAVIDSERGSASKYADRFEFDVCELESFAPADYVKAIGEAEAAGYDVLVIDSLSHAWEGKGGALEMVDNAAARSKSGNKFTAWREVTPQHNRLVESIVGSSCHVIVTMRAKTEYVLEEDEKGRKVPRKIGMAPIQRSGVEYEFDVVCDLDHELRCIVTKTRCPDLSQQVFREAGEDDLGATYGHWLGTGSEPPARKLTPAERQKVGECVEARCDELGLEKKVYLAAAGRECVGRVGFEKLAEVPQSKLNDLLQQVSHWTPQEADDFNQDLPVGDAAA